MNDKEYAIRQANLAFGVNKGDRITRAEIVVVIGILLIILAIGFALMGSR